MTQPYKTSWHELSTWEPEAALAFYGATLGWKFEASPLPDGESCWIARKGGGRTPRWWRLRFDGTELYWHSFALDDLYGSARHQ